MGRARPDLRGRAAGGRAAKLDCAYGEGPRERLDLFFPDGPSKGLVVFVHGGFWMRFDKSFWSHLAEGPVRRGWAVAVPSYALAPAVRIRDITPAIARAIAYAASRAPGPIALAGHSAGGHLVARMACLDGPLPAPERARLVRVAPISGLFDLRPLMRTRMNRTLGLDEAEAVAESPALARPLPGLNLTAWVGADERPEFVRQSDSSPTLDGARRRREMRPPDRAPPLRRDRRTDGLRFRPDRLSRALSDRGRKKSAPRLGEPARAEQERDDGESGREPDPHPDPAERRRKAERQADRRADPPVADERDDERPAGFVQAAEHVGERRLGSVEDLEDRRDPQEGDGDPDRRGVLRRVDRQERRNEEPRRGDHQCGR